MRAWLSGGFIGAALLLAACGGKVIVDGRGGQGTGGAGGSAQGGTGGDPCAGKSCGDPCIPCQSCAGTCDLDGACVLGQEVECGPPNPCVGKLCGDGCTVCNDIECLQGRCSVSGTCEFEPVPCP